MPISKNVAQLYSGNEFRGSAWFINEDYALTARHCVCMPDSCEYSDLSLRLNSQEVCLEVEVKASSDRIDVALLKVKKVESSFLAPVLYCSVDAVSCCQACVLHGHPGLGAELQPDGVGFKGEVMSPSVTHTIRGEEGNHNIEAIHIGKLGLLTSKLEGISGGPVCFDDGDGVYYAFGLVVEKILEGSYVVAVPLGVIAKELAIVSDIITCQRKIVITEKDKKIYWDAPLLPSKIHTLYEKSNPPLITAIDINFDYYHEKKLACALQRFINAIPYSLDIKIISDRGWDEIRNKNIIKKIQTATSEVIEKKSSIQQFEGEELAREIHLSLNDYLISQVDGALYSILKKKDKNFFQGRIEKELAEAMWDEWLQWQYLFAHNQSLLFHFFELTFCHKIESKSSDELTNAVPNDNTLRSLAKVLLFSLALAAADIKTVPSSTKGNVLVETYDGHACAIEFVDDRKIGMEVMGVDWDISLIVFAYLNESIARIRSLGISLMSKEGTKDVGYNYPIPISIVDDIHFNYALENGINAIRCYYENSKKEASLTTISVPSPTGELDVND